MIRLLIGMFLSLGITHADAADLHEAAGRGDLAVLKTGVKNAKTANLRNADGESLLQAAAGAGDVKAVEFLLGKGADINAVDKAGDSVLLTAVSSGQGPIARLLIRKNADLGLRYGEKKENILFEAVRLGDIPTIREVTKKNPSLVSDVNTDGETALFESVRSAQSEAAQALIKAGARRDAVRKDGKKPEDLANPRVDLKILKILKGS